ncbi:MAG: hypothetical protein EOO88_35670 [Pedobacter sp.]|nr:MAG: hypothetical protein EOO88_35670 [Pedobacter sp.]
MSNIQEIKQHLASGDYTRIGKMLGISRKYARILLNRPTASKHDEAVRAAQKVANSNIDLGL